MKPSVVYHIFPDRFYRKGEYQSFLSKWDMPPKYDSYFGGDIQGIIAKIGYLKDLGVESLYLNPIFEASSNHRYDTKNYFKIDPILGNDDDFSELLSSLHSTNIALILDGVFNHCGVDFFAFRDLLNNNQRSIYRDWFIVKKFPIKIEKGFYQCWKNHPQLIEFNFSNSTLRNYITKVAEYWTLKGIDGWRLDAPERIPEFFWIELIDRLKRINKDLVFIGEIWSKANRYLQYFDSVTNYQFRENVISYVKGKRSGMDFLESFENYYFSYPFRSTLLSWNILSSHDTERIATVLNGDIEKIKLAVGLQFVLPGSPIIYYGDEVGLRGGNDPDCRRTFNWNERSWNKEIFNYYKTMINLYKSYEALRYGNYEKIYTDFNIAVFKRKYKNKSILIIANNSKKAVISLPINSIKPLTNKHFIYEKGTFKLLQGLYVFLL